MRAPSAIYWCGKVVIDRRRDQLGEVLVRFHAVTIQHRGRATRSIDHDTHGHRLGQDKAQAGFEVWKIRMLQSPPPILWCRRLQSIPITPIHTSTEVSHP